MFEAKGSLSVGEKGTPTGEGSTMAFRASPWSIHTHPHTHRPTLCSQILSRRSSLSNRNQGPGKAPADPTARRPNSGAGRSPHGQPVKWGAQVSLTCFGSKPMVHFEVGAPPILVCFSGDWDVHWGYGILTHGHVSKIESHKTREETTDLNGRCRVRDWCF